MSFLTIHRKILGALIGIILGGAPFLGFAATLSLSPSSGTQTIGSIFPVTIQLSTGTDQVDGVDIHYINYPPALLEVQDENAGTSGVQITAGSLLPITQQNSVDTTNGRIDFSQVTSGGTRYNNTSAQTLATVRFRVLAAGTANLTFTYANGSTTDTNVAVGGVDTLTTPGTVSFTLAAGFNFSMTASAPSAVTQGGSTTSTISTALTSSTSTAVSLSASGLPTGAIASFSPASCTPACTSTLTLQTSGTTPTGNHAITVTGVGGGVTRTTTATLMVNPPNVSNIGFNVSLEGDSNQNDNAFEVTVYSMGTSTIVQQFTNRTPAAGRITLATTTIAPGSYDIKFITPFYLAKEIRNIALATNGIITVPILLAGDLNSDNAINSLDWSLMSPRWNLTDAAADINKDGTVNSIDFSFMNKNWGVAGDT